jgi:hypothetical protein
MLAKRGDAEVFAAGDDDQSIYSFRHAALAPFAVFLMTILASRFALGECLRCGLMSSDFEQLIAQEQIASKSHYIGNGLACLSSLLPIQNRRKAVARAIKAEVEAGTPGEKSVLVKSIRTGTSQMRRASA